MALAKMRGIDMKNIKRQKNLKRQCGASLVEYGLLVSLICLAAVPAIKSTGGHIGVNMCMAAQDISGQVRYDPSIGCLSVRTPCRNGTTTHVFSNGSIACLQ